MHRVIHRGDKYRVSIPFFFEPSVDSVINPLPSFNKEGEKPKVESIAVRSSVFAVAGSSS